MGLKTQGVSSHQPVCHSFNLWVSPHSKAYGPKMQMHTKHPQLATQTNMDKEQCLYWPPQNHQQYSHEQHEQPHLFPPLPFQLIRTEGHQWTHAVPHFPHPQAHVHQQKPPTPDTSSLQTPYQDHESRIPCVQPWAITFWSSTHRLVELEVCQ